MKTVHKKPREKPAKPGVLPTRDELKKFLAQADDKIGLREIARTFKIGPDEKSGLRGLLKSLEGEGAVERAGPKKFILPGRLPENAVVEVTGIDRDGEALARPVLWDGPGRPPIIFMAA